MMFNNYKTHTDFSVDDMARARGFYEKTLGLKVQTETPEGLLFKTGGDTCFNVYRKPDHQPAQHTVMSFEVDQIEPVMSELKQKGVTFEKVEGTDEKGIAVHGAQKAAWFKDPAGNWLCLTELH